MASPLSPLAAMASAVTFGVADFTGGRAGRRSSAPSVAAGIELNGLTVLPLAIVLLPLGWEPHSALLAFVGGAIGGLGLVAFYRAMSLHLIGVIAPIAGFVGAALPTAVGLITGERLGIWQLGGVGIGLGAIALINGEEVWFWNCPGSARRDRVRSLFRPPARRKCRRRNGVRERPTRFLSCRLRRGSG